MAAQHRSRLNQLFLVSRQTKHILASSAAVTLLWEISGRVLELNPSFLPTPSRILLEIWHQAPVLRRNAGTTIEEIALGLTLAVLLAASLSLMIALFPSIDPFMTPLLRAVRRAPLLALAPVLLIWFSFGLLPKVLIVLLMAFFPAAEGILIGLRSVPEDIVELLRAMRAGSLKILLKIGVPGSLPCFFGGLKTAVRLGVSGAVVAEFVAADSGLGYLMLSGISKMDVPLVFAALTILTAVAFSLYVIVTLVERISMPWRVEIGDGGGVCCGWYE